MNETSDRLFEHPLVIEAKNTMSFEREDNDRGEVHVSKSSTATVMSLNKL